MWLPLSHSIISTKVFYHFPVTKRIEHLPKRYFEHSCRPSSCNVNQNNTALQVFLHFFMSLKVLNLETLNAYLIVLYKEYRKNKSKVNDKVAVHLAFWVLRSSNQKESSLQFVIFKPLSYCFEGTIGLEVKASFASRPVSRLIRWYNKPGDITKEFW